MIRKIMMLAMIAPSLGACGATRLYEAARDADTADGAYAAALQAGYVRLARDELREGDRPDTKHFARKALRIAESGDVEPDALGERRLREAAQPELKAARRQLLDAKGHAAGGGAPSELANAQIMFECWLQEREEDFQQDDIEACRAGFQRAMSGLEGTMAQYESRAGEVARIATASNASADVFTGSQPDGSKSQPGPYVIYFDFDDAELSLNAKAALDLAADEIIAGAPTLLVIAGYADRAGKVAYNDRLSRRRAEAVASYLLDLGVPENSMQIVSHGEGRLSVKTADGEREARNRRVEVSARPNQESSSSVASR